MMSMDLENQIAQISNPQDFMRICDLVLESKYGDAYQAIDDSRSDGGNDGYIAREKRMVAVYCPKKPERQTDSKYLEKIKSDLTKAHALKSAGKLEIETWTFITPRKIGNDVFLKMQEMGEEFGITTNQKEASFLALEIQKNPHIASEIPGLFINQIDEKMEKILEGLEKVIPPDQSYNNSVEQNSLDETAPEEQSIEFDKLNQIFNSLDLSISQRKKAIRNLMYESLDPQVEVTALQYLINLRDIPSDTDEDILKLCEQGLSIARNNTIPDFEVIFLMKKGELLTSMYCDYHLKFCKLDELGNVLGMELLSAEERQREITHTLQFYESLKECFSQALGIIREIDAPYLFANLLMTIGSAAGVRSLHYRSCKLDKEADGEDVLSRNSLSRAKHVLSGLGSELGVAYAFHNLANHLRFVGEKEEALNLAEKALKVFREHGENFQASKTEMLIERITTGEIPNYYAMIHEQSAET